ncbi:MAG: gene transfer agent family protein [Alphaproteobacteria bacterium]|nr:MAG: gene transfer agent family protein [Alphaproteobacteria bacterium]
MSGVANPARGEASILVGGERLVLRPSFEALVAAEEELGPLFGLVERAAAGGLRLSELTGLFWHCLEGRPEGVNRERLGAAIAEGGLARATPALRVLLQQILQGSGAV